MARMVRRSRAAIGRPLLASGFILLGSWVWSSADAVADDPALPFGRWRLESRGLDWPCRIDSLEVRESNLAGEALLFAFERGEDGQARPSGSARIDRKAAGPSATRWFSASWPSGASTLLIQVRPGASGRLVAVIRERSRDRVVGDRVRQVVFAPSPTDGPALPLEVAGRAIRFDSDGSSLSKAKLTGVFVARSDGGGRGPWRCPTASPRRLIPAGRPTGVGSPSRRPTRAVATR